MGSNHKNRNRLGWLVIIQISCEWSGLVNTGKSCVCVCACVHACVCVCVCVCVHTLGMNCSGGSLLMYI